MATVNIPSRNIRHRKGQADVNAGVVIVHQIEADPEDSVNKKGKKECTETAVDIAERQ